MDHPTRRRRSPRRPLWLGAVLLVALLGTLALAPDQARTTVQAGTRALAGWLLQTMWFWPLAAALTLAALTSPPAHRRWPRPIRRIRPAIGSFVGLVALASLATASRPRLGVLVLGVVVGVGLLATWVLVVPRRVAPPVPPEVLDRLNDRDRLEVTDARVKLQNDLRTTALQAIAGLAVLAGAVLGFQQLTEDRQQSTAARELTLQGQASERFTRAIDQLGSSRLEVQLGGIYGLEQIAQQAPANRLAVTEVLVAYLHRRVPRPAKPPPDGPVEELRSRVPDAQAALTVLGRRQTARTDPPLDLRALDLRAATLDGATLRRADLGAGDLRRATLRGADLGGTVLRDTNLRGAVLRDTNLRGADLHGAIVVAILHGADLRAANLGGANLGGADLGGADLGHAIVDGADLRRAILIRADLRSAVLAGADLLGAFLDRADLRDANLRGAKLSDTNVRDANLRGAIADQHTTWPAGFDWQGAGVRLVG